MLAVFARDADRKRARLDASIAANNTPRDSDDSEDEAAYEAMAPLVSSLPRRQRGYVNECILGPGSCIGYLETLDQIMADDEQERAICFVRGDIDCEGLGDDDVIARHILDQYLDKWPSMDPAPTQEWINTNIGALQGNFVLLIYDMRTRRVIAARGDADAHGLCWGRTSSGAKLVVGSDPSFLEDVGSPHALPPSAVLVSDAGAARDAVFVCGEDAGKQEAGEEVEPLQKLPTKTKVSAAPAAELAA